MRRYEYRVHVFDNANEYACIAEFVIRAFSFKRSLKRVKQRIIDMGICGVGKHIGIVEFLTL